MSSVPLCESLLTEQLVNSPHSKCIHELFSECAAQNPERKALTYGDEFITYRELDLKTNRLAHKLRLLGVDRDTPVAICAERSPKLLAGLLAILKAGGAYFPLDTCYPLERITMMLEDVKPPLVLIEEKFTEPIRHLLTFLFSKTSDISCNDGLYSLFYSSDMGQVSFPYQILKTKGENP